MHPVVALKRSWFTQTPGCWIQRYWDVTIACASCTSTLECTLVAYHPTSRYRESDVFFVHVFHLYSHVCPSRRVLWSFYTPCEVTLLLEYLFTAATK